MKIIVALIIVGLLGVTVPDIEVRSVSAERFLVLDKFGRLAEEVVVVDWEGYIANPAMAYSILPPDDAAYPLTVTLRADHPRLHFDVPSTVGENGPEKILRFINPAPQTFYVAIWHDDDSSDELYALTLDISEANGTSGQIELPIMVIDQDQLRPPDFQLAFQFIDQGQGFFDESEDGNLRKSIAREAAQSWAYFLADMDFDEVPARDEQFFVWDADGFYETGQMFVNEQAFTGFLFVFSTKDTPVPPYTVNELRSGAQALGHGWQTRDGQTIRNAVGDSLFKRSATVEFEVKGNYNDLGWILNLNDDDWWRYLPTYNDPTDLFSVALHEAAHGLAFDHRHYAGLRDAPVGGVTSPQILEYYGEPVVSDEVTHFSTIIDPASRRGVFGNDFHHRPGYMPQYRWVITKLDLLLLQAAGYELRETSAFIPLQVPAEELVIEGIVGQPLRFKIAATGGIPPYNFVDKECRLLLPGGLMLNSWSGVISGTPQEAGIFEVTVEIEDYDSTTPRQTTSILLVVRGEAGQDVVDLPSWADVRVEGCDTKSDDAVE